MKLLLKLVLGFVLLGQLLANDDQSVVLNARQIGDARDVVGNPLTQSEKEKLKNARTATDVSAILDPRSILEIVINPDYAYPAYGVPSEETNEAIRLAAKTEAMITDPVYEGKSMQGLIDLTKKGFFPAGSKVLYAHLGGAPALNGYSYHYKDG